jgi:hypothetical protein
VAQGGGLRRATHPTIAAQLQYSEFAAVDIAEDRQKVMGSASLTHPTVSSDMAGVALPESVESTGEASPLFTSARSCA